MEEVQDKLQTIVEDNIKRNAILGKYMKNKELC